MQVRYTCVFYNLQVQPITWGKCRRAEFHSEVNGRAKTAPPYSWLKQ